MTVMSATPTGFGPNAASSGASTPGLAGASAAIAPAANSIAAVAAIATGSARRNITPLLFHMGAGGDGARPRPPSEVHPEPQPAIPAEVARQQRLGRDPVAEIARRVDQRGVILNV